MADGSLTSAPPPEFRPRVHAAVRVGVIYLASRVVTTLFMLAAAGLSTAASRHGVAPSLGEFFVGWDAQWYWLIAEQGYPHALPVGQSGHVAQNAWAFMPVYAVLSKAVGFGFWPAGALVVTLVSGYLACLVFYRLMRERLDRSAASWAVLFLAAGPMAAMFQVGYAESLNLLWLMLSLWCVVRRQFWWLYLLVPLMGFTRPGVLAFSLFLALYGIWRWMQRRRDPLPITQAVHIVVLGLWALIVGFSWQVIAGLVTGDMGSYLATELSWRIAWVGDGPFIPFAAWVQAAEFWFVQWGLGVVTGYVVLAAVVLGTFAALIWLPAVRRLGIEIRLWSAAYVVYLLAVFFPQSSVFRLLFPLSPLWGAVAVPRSLWWRGGVLLAGLLAQFWWIVTMYGTGNLYWQVP